MYDPLYLDYAAIRRRASRRLAMRVAFISHLLTFALITPGRFTTPSTSWPATIWFVVLMLHFGLWLYSELHERAIRKEIEREEQRLARRYALLAPSEKPKRDLYHHLEEESVYDLDTEPDDQSIMPKSKR